MFSLKLGRRIIRMHPPIRRTYLSSAYKCEEVWQQRKRNPMFQKIDYDDLYHQLDRNFQVGQRVSMLDVDLFVNGISNETYQNELEDVLYKARLTPETGLMADRTMHAVVRYYISIGKKNELLTILSNRLTYGIFPDFYVSNTLISEFLKDKDFIGATKISVLQMLQEDFNHEILRILCIFSCVKYLASSEIWSPPKVVEVKEEDEDEDEIEKVRVTYLRNPYFDDHFDIIDTNHLVGKTLYMAGLYGDSKFDISSQIIGLALYEKYELLLELSNRLLKTKDTVYLEAVEKAIDYLKVKPKQVEGSIPSQDDEALLKLKSKLIVTLENLGNSSAVVVGNLEEVVEQEVKKTIENNISHDIQNISKLYREWEAEREEHIQLEIRESQKRKAQAEIEKTKQELQNREEAIFFFDKEDEWKLKVEEKEEEMRLLAEQQSKVKKKSKEEDYIPPDVQKKRE